MGKRLILKPGDIFSVKLSTGKFKFFQFLLCDQLQLHGNVIRVFSLIKDDKDFDDFQEVVQSDVEFYVCTSCKVGYKQGYWEKVGNFPIEDKLELPPFISFSDVSPGIVKSYKWRIRYVNEDYQFIGELSDKYKNLSQDRVWPPNFVVNKIETGKFGAALEDVE